MRSSSGTLLNATWNRSSGRARGSPSTLGSVRRYLSGWSSVCEGHSGMLLGRFSVEFLISKVGGVEGEREDVLSLRRRRPSEG